MRQIYKLELLLVITGILIASLMLLNHSSNLTGYVSALNVTVYVQNIEIVIDGSQSYSLASMSSGNLNLKSLRIDGEVVGNGRVEVFLDNNAGNQYLVYENVREKPDYTRRNPITAMVVSTDSAVSSMSGEVVGDGSTIDKKVGTWLVIQPKKYNVAYEFEPLQDNEVLVTGDFYTNCMETCDISPGEFNSGSYNLIFRIENGTFVNLRKLEYTLHENEQ
jgi:hypothetical protein